MTRQFVLRLGRPVHLPIAFRTAVVVVGLGSALLVLTLASLKLGSTPISLRELFLWLLSYESKNNDTAAIMELRWPRIAAAILGGAMVATSGYLLQLVSRNGLADPGLLGISQGTMAAVVLGAMIFGIPAEWLAVTGLAGGMATAVIVLSLAQKLASGTGLILLGLAVGIVLGAIIEIVMIQGGILQFSRWLSWSHGSLTAVSAASAATLFRWAVVLLAVSLLAGHRATPLLLGAEQAMGIGAAPRLLAPALTFLAAALVAPVVAAIGPISFLGLICAHLARRLVGERPGAVIPVTMLCGALTLLAADTAGRTLFGAVIIPAGILVSVAGVLAFLTVARLSRSQP